MTPSSFAAGSLQETSIEFLFGLLLNHQCRFNDVYSRTNTNDCLIDYLGYTRKIRKYFILLCTCYKDLAEWFMWK